MDECIMKKLLFSICLYAFSFPGIVLSNEDIHLECSGNYLDVNLDHQIEVIINPSNKTIIFPQDPLANIFEITEENRVKYPPLGIPPAYLWLKITDDEYKGSRDVPGYRADSDDITIMTQNFSVNRKNLTYTIFNKLAKRFVGNVPNKNGYVRIRGKCKIYEKQENLI